MIKKMLEIASFFILKYMYKNFLDGNTINTTVALKLKKGSENMKIKHLKNIKTLEELKKGFRNLAFKLHPDKGGSQEAMQELNNEYSYLSKELSKEAKNFNDNIEADAPFTRYRYAETTEQADEYRDIIEKLINCIGLEIEICGSWIWLSGETKEYKELIKTLGFKWASKKKMWSFGEMAKGKKNHKPWSIDKIRNNYGSTKFKNKDKDPLLT